MMYPTLLMDGLLRDKHVSNGVQAFDSYPLDQEEEIDQRVGPEIKQQREKHGVRHRRPATLDRRGLVQGAKPQDRHIDDRHVDESDDTHQGSQASPAVWFLDEGP